MDLAIIICAILADIFASEKEREEERQALQSQIDDLRDELDELKGKDDEQVF